MKKMLFAVISLCLAVALFGCGIPSAGEETPGTTAATLTPETTGTPETTLAAEEKALLPLPWDTMSFLFQSGVGAWHTGLELTKDAYFSGEFYDSDSIYTTDEYPHGTIYTCTFSGMFVDIQQINEYTYHLTLADLRLEKAPGEEWITTGYRYVSCTPYGIDGGTEFILYLPETPLSELPEEFLSWWPYRFNQDENYTTLSCYGILNVATGHGFFSH